MQSTMLFLGLLLGIFSHPLQANDWFIEAAKVEIRRIIERELSNPHLPAEKRQKALWNWAEANDISADLMRDCEECHALYWMLTQLSMGRSHSLNSFIGVNNLGPSVDVYPAGILMGPADLNAKELGYLTDNPAALVYGNDQFDGQTAEKGAVQMKRVIVAAGLGILERLKSAPNDTDLRAIQGAADLLEYFRFPVTRPVFFAEPNRGKAVYESMVESFERLLASRRYQQYPEQALWIIDIAKKLAVGSRAMVEIVYQDFVEVSSVFSAGKEVKWDPWKEGLLAWQYRQMGLRELAYLKRASDWIVKYGDLLTPSEMVTLHSKVRVLFALWQRIFSANDTNPEENLERAELLCTIARNLLALRNSSREPDIHSLSDQGYFTYRLLEDIRHAPLKLVPYAPFLKINSTLLNDYFFDSNAPTVGFSEESVQVLTDALLSKKGKYSGAANLSVKPGDPKDSIVVTPDQLVDKLEEEIRLVLTNKAEGEFRRNPFRFLGMVLTFKHYAKLDRLKSLHDDYVSASGGSVYKDFYEDFYGDVLAKLEGRGVRIDKLKDDLFSNAREVLDAQDEASEDQQGWELLTYQEVSEWYKTPSVMSFSDENKSFVLDAMERLLPAGEGQQKVVRSDLDKIVLAVGKSASYKSHLMSGARTRRFQEIAERLQTILELLIEKRRFGELEILGDSQGSEEAYIKAAQRKLTKKSTDIEKSGVVTPPRVPQFAFYPSNLEKGMGVLDAYFKLLQQAPEMPTVVSPAVVTKPPVSEPKIRESSLPVNGFNPAEVGHHDPSAVNGFNPAEVGHHDNIPIYRDWITNFHRKKAAAGGLTGSEFGEIVRVLKASTSTAAQDLYELFVKINRGEVSADEALARFETQIVPAWDCLSDFL